MSLDPAVTRRAILVTGAAGAGTVLVAACSSGSSSGNPSGTPSASASSTDRPGDMSSGTPSDKPGSTVTGRVGGALASLDDIPVGQAISVTLPDGKPGIVSRPSAGTAACFSAICTHEGCTVKPAKSTLDCPCHGSKYDAATGAVRNGPASSPLQKVDVAVRNGKVVSA